MKLSEAIRLGSMMKGQAFGYMVNVQYRTKKRYEHEIPQYLHPQDAIAYQANVEVVHTTCALGAALDAIGKLTVHFNMDAKKGIPTTINQEFPILDKTCDFTLFHKSYYHGMPTVKLGDAIIFMNDKMHLKREQIADYVETVEKYYEQLEQKRLPASTESNLQVSQAEVPELVSVRHS